MQAPRGPFCQSCSMPMDAPEKFGTDADGSKNQDYCVHCYQDGEFRDANATLEGMIESCAGIMAEKTGIEREQAKAQLSQLMPRLKRWRETTSG